MKITNVPWKIRAFLESKQKIESQPVYQRSLVWSEPKQRLLIDSILRGLDIPKIYLRRLPNNKIFNYQIVDGQQRLTAIWEFASDNLKLSLPDDLAEASWADCTFETLRTTDKTSFEEFSVIVGVVEDATDSDVRELFSRLQLGVHLTPPEIRNSIPSALGVEVRNIAENHRFFTKCVFPATRFKHHDLAAHAFALQLYRGQQDLKAPNLKAMYVEYKDSVRPSLTARVASVLDILCLVQDEIPGWINRKWGFVDLYLFLSLITKRNCPPVDLLAQRYKSFEMERRQNVANPEHLLQGRRLDRLMYKYIKAFAAQGGLSTNIQIRHNALRTHLLSA